MSDRPLVSVIVPVAPGESFIDSCLGELSALPEDFELLVVSADETEAPGGRIRAVRADGPGRARSLNRGAEESSGDWLWFVHADSKLPRGIEAELLRGIERHPGDLLYFGIHYYDGTLRHRLNSAGASWRSRLFGAPFGDQAFCVPRSLHDAIGGFREDAPYGEDHLYARAARRRGANLVALPCKVGTSARRHLEEGWLNITARYQWMWISQALRDRAGGCR